VSSRRYLGRAIALLAMEVAERQPDDRVTLSMVMGYCLERLGERCTTSEILGMLDGFRAKVVEESGDEV
jgi:hypothetical protein